MAVQPDDACHACHSFPVLMPIDAPTARGHRTAPTPKPTRNPRPRRHL